MTIAERELAYKDLDNANKALKFAYYVSWIHLIWPFNQFL